MNKRGFLLSKKTISIILIIIGLAVILLFLWKAIPRDEIDKQACHQSVIYKATVPLVGGIKLAELPLDCKTEKICITDKILGGANCDADYLGEKYSTVRVTSNKKEQDEEINAIIAKKFEECWWMMGEGKVQVYSRGLSFDEGRECNVCTRIAFDKDLKEKRKGEVIKGYQEYLLTKRISTGQTYWQYISNSDSNYMDGFDEKKDNISFEQSAIIFAEVGQGALKEWFPAGGTLSGVVGGAAIGGYVGSVVPIAGTIAGAIAGAGIGGIIGHYSGKGGEKVIDYFQGTGAEVYSIIEIRPYNLNNLRDINCSNFRGGL